MATNVGIVNYHCVPFNRTCRFCKRSMEISRLQDELTAKKEEKHKLMQSCFEMANSLRMKFTNQQRRDTIQINNSKKPKNSTTSTKLTNSLTSVSLSSYHEQFKSRRLSDSSSPTVLQLLQLNNSQNSSSSQYLQYSHSSSSSSPTSMVVSANNSSNDSDDIEQFEDEISDNELNQNQTIKHETDQIEEFDLCDTIFPFENDEIEEN